MLDVGVVVIGRNEGGRLKNCIYSLLESDLRIVYVDSNSVDDSVEFVRKQGFDVVELDMSIPFSAARARNEGYQYLISCYDGLQFIQFVDGDCEVYEGWMQTAYQHLLGNSALAAVCGRRRERYPNKTVYNRFCDIEWNTPVGPAMFTGGDFLCRVKALLDVDGFDPQVVAGEEPEMCFRMRQKNWLFERLDVDMTLHDANMCSIKQWWKRSERSGHAYAQGFFMHGHSAEKYRQKDVLRIVLWALIIPLVIISLTIFIGPLSLLLFFIYPLKSIQMAPSEIKKHGFKVGLLYSFSLVAIKFPQLQGIINFLYKKAMGKTFQLIEYKGS